jgi:hypothetical protein
MMISEQFKSLNLNPKKWEIRADQVAGGQSEEKWK